jgi:hypothetical protein
MKLIVLPQAADEFEDAVAHYDDKQAGPATPSGSSGASEGPPSGS